MIYKTMPDSLEASQTITNLRAAIAEAEKCEPVMAFRHKESGEIRYTINESHIEDEWEDVCVSTHPAPKEPTT